MTAAPARCRHFFEGRGEMRWKVLRVPPNRVPSHHSLGQAEETLLGTLRRACRKECPSISHKSLECIRAVGQPRLSQGPK